MLYSYEWEVTVTTELSTYERVMDLEMLAWRDDR